MQEEPSPAKKNCSGSLLHDELPSGASLHPRITLLLFKPNKCSSSVTVQGQSRSWP